MIVYLQTFRWTEICLEKNNQYFPNISTKISQKLATNQKRHQTVQFAAII